MTRLEWIVDGHTGISSTTMWAHFIFNKEPRGKFGAGVPRDPSDFLRCYWLLKITPEWKPRLGELAARYPEWRGLVDHWGELEKMLEEALPQSCATGEYCDEQPAEAMYRRMKELGV